MGQENQKYFPYQYSGNAIDEPVFFCALEKAYLAAMAPGRKSVPMKKASPTLYWRLTIIAATIATAITQ